MAKKRNMHAAVETPTSGGELEARDLSPEACISNLKRLNNILVKETAEHREQIHQLRSKLASLAADHDIVDATEGDVFKLVLSSSLSDAAARSTAEVAAAMETAGKMLKSTTAKLNAAEMRLLVEAKEKDRVERDLELVVEERDLSRGVVDEKRKELLDLKESIRSLKQALAQMLKEREVADAKCRKLEEDGKRREEELRSVIHEKDFLERCREDDKRVVEQLVREMGLMKSQKDVDMDTLNAENKANASKVEALEEECRFLKEIRGQLENEVGDLKVSLEKLEEVKLSASHADCEKRYTRVEEDLKRYLSEYGRLKKEKLELEKTFHVKEKEMTLQINELKENMTKMVAEKNLVDQSSTKYEIQITNLQAEISELQSARRSLEDAHISCSEIIAMKESCCAAMRREKNLKAEEAVALKKQLNESMNTKHIMELTIEELQRELNHLTAENDETRKQIDSFIVEKASLEKHLETSNQGLQDIEKKLKTSQDASGEVFALLKKITTEVMDKERTQENCISRETGVEVENNEEMKLLVDNLEAIRLAVKGKDTKITDLNQKLELLQLSVAYAKNREGIWKWLFPATTTIFAAVSLAYAARAR